MNENKFWILVWSLLTAVLITLIISIACYNVTTTELYTSRGYCEEALVGSSYTIWTKCH